MIRITHLEIGTMCAVQRMENQDREDLKMTIIKK